MTTHFFMIYIERDENIAFEHVKKKMDSALDWYRLNEKIWIVYSSSDPEKWYERLQKFVENSGSLFICQLEESNRQGWMSKKFWEWLKKAR